MSLQKDGDEVIPVLEKENNPLVSFPSSTTRTPKQTDSDETYDVNIHDHVSPEHDLIYQHHQRNRSSTRGSQSATTPTLCEPKIVLPDPSPN